jgi:glycosyltransferase involved in cell wall biosynthesis
MTSPSAPVDVTVVLPVYNEAGHLHEELDRIRASLLASEHTYELLVVDDGSTDGSTDGLEDSDDLRVIRLPVNRGSGTARRVGTREARGDVVVWTDVDMTYPNDRIPELVKELEGYDQVVGARTTEEGTKKALRVPAKWTIRKLAEYLSDTEIPDLNSGFRAFRRSVADQYLHLLPTGFSCVTTITMSFLANGYTVKYVPIDYAQRAGTSKFHWRKDTSRYLVQVIRLVLSYNPLRFFGPIGGLLALIGVAKLGFDLADKDWRVGTNTLLVLFAAFQVLVIGLLADLVVRVTRPRDEVIGASR